MSTQVKDIKLTINSRLENIGLVGLAVQTLCREAGFDEVETYRIQLSVVEAVANVIKHAYHCRPGHEATVTISIDPDRITFRIMDTGQAMNLLYWKPLEFDPTDRANLPEGGMGLHIIQKVMDGVDYRTEGGINILTMYKNRRKGSPS
jgi:serine/threonine-protein kinase RsbW